MYSLGSDIEIYGDGELLGNPLVIILNSRQTKTPVGNDPWVKATVAAVQAVSNEGFTLITSVGMNTWELALWAAANSQCRIVILIPKEKGISVDNKAEELAEDFGVNLDHSLWLSIPPKPGSRGKKGWWDRRDSMAFDLAERIYPLCIRPEGRWSNLLSSPEASAKEIIEDFKTPYPKPRKSPPLLSPGLEVPEVRPWTYLTHWTRRCYEPWPGEKASDFYQDIVSSEDSYPRSASATLRRIIEEELIRGSSERIRGGEKVVALTALPPDEALQLMQWRPRFTRPTFEPYGICIHRKAAQAAGIRPVEYLPQGLKSVATPKALQQGFGRGLWPIEAEWRTVGDIDLRKLSPKFIRIVVPTAAETGDFKSISKYKTITLEKLNEIMTD